MSNDKQEFIQKIKGFGFRVFLANPKYSSKDYGFITDESGARVLSFSFNDLGLSGKFCPESNCGTGWKQETTLVQLKTVQDIKNALYALAPRWTGNRHPVYTTLEKYLAVYQSSSQFKEV